MSNNDRINYLWEFGDGTTSNEISPIHIYYIPGVYTVKLTITFGDGSTYTMTRVDYITIRDFDWGSEYDVSFTNTCYRASVNNSQGIGITKYTGDNWLYPTAYWGTCKGFTENGDLVGLVCDNRTGRFYRIDVPEVWTDKTDSYGGYEITSKIKLKERTAVAGEYQEIEHVESHIHIRPFKETYRNETEYTSEGFRDAHSIDLQFYENGEPITPYTKLEDISRYGDYVSRKRLEARRIQEEYIFYAAAWRIVKTQERYMPIDKSSGPAYDYPTEQQWQDEFRSAVLWLSRDRLRPTYNRSTATAITGDYDQLTTGPDNQAKSAMAFALTHSLSTTLNDITGDFTLSMWLGSMASFPSIVFQSAADLGTLLISITDAGGSKFISFNDGVNIFSSLELVWSGTGWMHLAVQRSDTYLKFFEDGTLNHSEELTDESIVYGGATIVANAIISSVFDVRLVETAISSDAIAYYYDQIINNGKQCPFLPIIR